MNTPTHLKQQKRINTMSLSNPTVLRDIIERYGFEFTKSLGQNFLIDNNIVESLARLSGADKDTAVLEVGPGIGTMTVQLAEMCGELTAVEIDKTLIPILSETLAPYPHARVINEDIMKADINAICDSFTKKRIVACANLPYYITTPVIALLLESCRFESLSIMIQKEVGDRLASKPGKGEYGAFTVFVNTYAEVDLAFKIPASCFMPRPNVDSVALKLNMRKDPLVPADKRDFFFKVVKAAFAQRRKTLVNSLSSTFGNRIPKADITQIITECGFNEKIRGEVLGIPEFYALSEKISYYIENNA